MRRMASAGGRRSRRFTSWSRRLGRYKSRFPRLLRTDFWRSSGRRGLWTSLFSARGRTNGEQTAIPTAAAIPTIAVRRRRVSRQCSSAQLRMENLEPRRMLAATPLYVANNWTLVSDADHSHTLSVGDLVSDGANANLTYGVQAFGKVTGSTDSNVTIVSPTSLAGSATIQDAVNAALASANSGPINIYAGTYSGALNISPSSSKSLTIVNLDASGNAAPNVLGSVVIDAGGASTGIAIGPNALASITGIKLQDIGIAGTGISDKGSLLLSYSQVDASGGAILGISVDNSAGGATGSLNAQNDQVSGASLFGIQVGGGTGASAIIGSSNINTNTTADVAVSAGNASITNSILSNTATNSRGLLVLSGGNAAIHFSDLSNNPFPVTNTNSVVDVDASGNYWGPSTSESAVLAETQGSVDISPYLAGGTDNALGFTPNLSTLYVTALGPQVGGGRIQEAVNDLASSGTININAGDYVENVIINKPLSLLGPNAGIDGTGTRGTEAVVLPPSDGHVGTPLLFVQASNVTIEGLELDGSNSALGATGALLNDGITYSQSAYGISNANDIDGSDTPATAFAVSGLVVSDNIIENFAQSGFVGDNGNLGATAGNTLSANLIQNISADTADSFGYAVALYNNFYAQITNNSILDSQNDIQIENFFLPDPSATPHDTVSGNTIDYLHRGIFLNLQYEGASSWTISSNVISADGSASAGNKGISVESIAGTVSEIISGNTISGATYGYELWNLSTSGTVTVSGGSVTGATYGVWVTNNAEFGMADTSSAAVISGVTITGASTAGIYVQGDGTNSVKATIEGDTVVSGSPTGVLVSGAKANAEIDNDNIFNNNIGVEFTAGGSGSLTGNQFSGATDNTTDLSLASTAGIVSLLGGNIFAGLTFIDDAASGELNATGETFILSGTNTVLPTDTDLDDLYDVEDRITDGLDAGQSGGLVRLRVGNVYVTQASDSIQRGVNLAQSGNNIYVQAGLYQENVVVNKSLSLFGANAGISGAAASGMSPTRTAGSETEVLTNGNQAAVFQATASHVTIDGFCIEGNDPSVTGGTLTSGNDSNAVYGVLAGTGTSTNPVSNITVENNVIKDVGVGFRGDGQSSTPFTGSLVTANWFDSIGAYDFGYAVTLRTNFYADVTDNLMTRVQSGVHLNAFSGTGGPAQWMIQDNTISAYGAGIWDNLQFNHATSATIDSNTITSLAVPNIPTNAAALANSSGNTIGILLVSIQDTVGATITNNNISGMAYGVTLYNTTTSNTITLDNTNTISGNGVGVFLTNIVPFNPVTTTILGGAANNPTGQGTAILNGISLSNNTAGVLVNDSNASTTFGVALTLENGVSISGGTTGLSVQGAKATIAGDTLANTSFASQSGNYIVLASGAEAGHEINATSATFDGTTGAGTTVAGNYAIEDKIVHAVDDGTLGFVRVTSGNVYVTPNSFNSPNTTVADVQRAINAASTGNTVHIEGGSYTGDVDTGSKNLHLELGASPASVSITGNLTLHSGDTVHLEVNAASADQLTVSGNVNLGGATLDTTGDTNPLQYPAGQSATVLIKSSGGAISGKFNGINDGDEINVNGEAFLLFYTGGNGNDVVLTSLGPAVVPPPPGGPFSPPGAPTTVYVNASWAGTSNGFDADGAGPGSAFGYDEFADIQSALNAVASGGTVMIANGTYDPSNILINIPVTIEGESESGVVITPSLTDSHDNSSFGGTASNGFIIASSNVTIKNLTLDGGASQNFRDGIITNSQNDNNTYINIDIENVTVKNANRKGIALYNYNGLSTGDIITNDTFDNIGSTSNDYEGTAAIAVFGSNADIESNIISNSAGGIEANSFDGTAVKLTVSGNQISLPASTLSEGALGIDVASLANGSVISGNTINLTRSGTGHNDIGIVVSFVQGSVTVSGNTVTGQNSDDGILLYQDTLSADPVLVQNNTVQGTSTGTGILITGSSTDTSRFGNGPDAVYATLTGNSVSGYGTNISVVTDGSTVSATIGDGTVAGQNTISGGNTGILVSGSGASALIQKNLIENITSGDDTAPDTGILLTSNGYASVENNTIQNVDVGIEISNFSIADGAGQHTISGNNISYIVTGIEINNLTGATSAFDVDSNTITSQQVSAVVNDGLDTGLLLLSINNTAGVTFTGNTINKADIGVYAWNNGTPLTITGGIIENARDSQQLGDAVLLSNNDPVDGGAATNDESLTLSGVSLLDNDTAIDVDASTGSTKVAIGLSNGTIITGVAGDLGIRLDGTNASVVGNTLNNTVFAFSGTPYAYIQLLDGALGGAAPVTLDATGVTFDGFAPATDATPASNLATYYAIEDLITDYLDDGAVGYVKLKSGFDFLAHSSEVASAGSLQRLVNASTASDTAFVEAGTFAGNVKIIKTLTLHGAQAGQSASTRYSAFTSGKADDTVETVITATVSNPTSVFDAGNNVLVRVLASNITLDGFVIDGNNPALVHQGTTLSGVAIDAGDGIANVDGSGNLVSVGGITLENNIVQNVNGEGVYFDLNNNAITTGSLVQGNVVSNVKYDGIGMFDNFYGDIKSNTILLPDNDIYGGIDLQNYYNTPGNIDVSGNTITEGQNDVGIFINLIYSSGTVIDVHNNTINAASGVVPGGTGTYGIAVWSVQVGSTVTMANNDIGTLPGSGIFDQGIDLWNLPTSNPVSISGGTITNSVVGIELDSVNPFYGAGDNSTVDISGVNITGGTIGILADAKSLPSVDSGSNIVSSDVTLDITGVTISGATTGIQVDAPTNAGNYTASADISGDTEISGATTGILISGPNASADIHDNNASIHGNTIGIEVSGGSATISNDHIYNNTTGVEFTAGGSGSLSSNDFRGDTASPAAANNVTDLLVDSSAGGVSLSGDTFAGSTFISNQENAELNATSETFELSGTSTILPTDNTLSDLYAVEDRITDGLDAGQTGGLVRLRAGNVYVTQASDSIQRGVNLAQSGNNIYVQAGTFHENLSINKPLDLIGANSGTAGSGSRGTETDIVTNGNQNAVVTILSSGITIDGFQLDGDDPSVTGATLTSGDDANALYGIRAATGFSNLTFENNIIQHVEIGFRGDSTAGSPTSGNLITRNWFDSIGVYDFGYAVSLRTNFYVDVTDNLMTRVQSGVHLNAFSGTGGPAQWMIQDNTISAYGAGIWDNLQFNHATSATIDGNTITSLAVPNIPANAAALANSSGNTIGILLVSIQDTVGATITNNNISGMAYGVTLYNTTTSNTITLDNTNTISGNGVGVYVTNKVDFNPVSRTELGGDPSNVPAGFSGPNNPSGTASVILNGITLANNGTGVLIRDANSFTTFGATATLENGVSISGGTTGLAVQGAKATIAGNTLANTSFTGQTGDYIALSNGAEAGHEINATSAIFDGTTGAGTTVAGNYAIEDKIVHAVDDGTLGFVRVTSGNVYVTPNSFIAPDTTSPSVQRGVDAASTGDTVNVEDGTYVGQVTISKDLTLLGESQSGTIIQASATMSSPFSTGSGAKFPVVFAGSNNVAIENLTVDGNAQGNAYADGFLGIAYYNAGGTVDHVTIENVENNPFNGVQNGVALYADNADSVARTLNITNNTINNYQKNGMALFGDGLHLQVTGNTVTGAGSTTQIAQNGIEVGDGATGTISNNTVSGNEYSGIGSGANQFTGVQSTGLLLFATSGLIVSNNIIDGNDIGIYNNTDNATISNNQLGDTTANRYEGILEDQGSATISGNIIHGGNIGLDVATFDPESGEAASAILTGNTVSGAGVGVEAIRQSAADPAVYVLAQSNTLTGNNVGVLVSGGAKADLGTDASDVAHANFTPLGTSTGHNILTGYTGTAGNYAIDDENLTANSDPDVLAEDNNFGPYVSLSQINQVIFDSHDNPTHTTVFILGALNQQPAPATVYVNGAWAGTPLGTDADGPTGGALGNGTAFGVDEFATIQDAINAVAPGGHVDIYNVVDINNNVVPYVENVDVTKSVTITGQSEAGVVVVPAVSNPVGGSLTNPVFLIDASNVTIQSLTVDGDNAALTSGVVVGGADIDATTGIITDWALPNTLTGITVKNVTVENIYLRGIEYADGVDGGTGTIDFENDTVTNVQGDPSSSIAIFNSFGSGTIANNVVSGTSDAINMNWSHGTNVFGNTITNSASGIHSDNNGGAGGLADNIHNNNVSAGTAGSFGIFVFSTYVNTSVSNNIISGVFVGLADFGGAGGTATFSGNSVSLGAHGVGAFVSTNMDPFGFANASASFSGDSFTGGDVGIELDQSAGGTASVSVTNVTIDDPGIGIDVDGGSATISGGNIYDNGTGVLFTDGGSGSVTGVNFDGGFGGSDNGTDLEIDADAGAVTIGAANTFAGNTYFINNESTQSFDLTGANAQTYTGLNPANLADDFRIEDHMFHKVDSAASGLITWVTGNIYVTSPGTHTTGSTDTDSSIQRGIDAASTGNTVNVEAGSFTENVTVNKLITLVGAGDGSNPATSTIINSAAGNTPVLALSTGGTSATNRLVVEDLRVTGATGSGNSGAGVSITGGTGFTTLDTVAAVGNGGDGFDINSTNAFTDIKILNSLADTNGNDGIRIPSSIAGLNGLLIDNTTISNNAGAGFETNPNGHANLPITNITVSNSHFSGNNTSNGSSNNDIDLFAFRGNVTLQNDVIAHSNASHAIQIDGRSQSGPAGNMVFDGVTITGTPGKSGIVIQNFEDQNLSSKLSFNNVDLSGVTPGTGWAELIIDAGAGQINLGNTKFKALGAGHPAAIAMNSAAGADATSAQFVDGSNAPVTNPFQIADSIVDAVDVSGLGLVRIVAGHVYVTPNSFLAPATTAASIQRGIDAASTGDIVNVEAGTYSGNVNVNKTVTLQGAQSGVAAPGRSGAESVINSPDGTTELQISANDATVDGFTIQGNTNGNVFGGGIFMHPGVAGTHLLNNIIQNNIVGLLLVNDSATDQAQIEGNLFQNNTNAGPSSGTDIYADQFSAGVGGVQDVLISGNTFTNSSFVENSWGIGLSNTDATPFSNITVSANTFSNTGRGMYFFNATGVLIDANTITGASHYGIGLFGPSDTNFEISRNTLNGNGDGIQIASEVTATMDVTGLSIHNNFIQNNGLFSPSASDNDGIYIDASVTVASGNIAINANSITGNTTAGLENDSAATITATSNWWGSADGPNSALNAYHPSNPAGDKIIGSNVNFAPWLTSGVDAQPAVPGFQPTVNASVPSVAVAPEVGNNNNEGSVQSYDATVTATTDPISYYWTVTKNSAPYASGQTLQSASLTNTFSFTPNDNASYVVTVTAVDQNGNSSTTSTNVSINNVAPTVFLTGPASANLGSTQTYSFTTSDPGSLDTFPQANLVISGGVYGSVNLQSYNPTTGAGTFTVTFTGAPPGHNISTVSVQLKDSDGGLSNLATINVTINNTLQVIGFTHNSSGFDVTFNRSPNLADLNLYDGPDVTVDLPDIQVVLNGDTAHPIQGSMTWNSTTNTLSWIKTGSALADGNYTVTLISGQNGTNPSNPLLPPLGFVDSASSGNLDGNANGNDTEHPDNYTNSFTIATNPGVVTVSIPDFARGPGQHVDINPASPGSSIPVSLDNANGVTSLDFDLFYNPALLTVNGAFLVSGLPGTWVATTNTTNPGELIVTASGSQPLSGTNVPVVLISADVPTTAPYESSQVLKIENAKVNGDFTITKDDFAIQKVVYLGDADGSGNYGAGDYSLIQRVAVGLDTGFDAHDWTDPLIIADISDAPNNPPSIDGQDAALVLQKALGQSVPQIPNRPALTLTFVSNGSDPSLLPSISPIAGGIDVSVSINVEPGAANKVTGITFDITYDGSLLQFNPPANQNDMLGSYLPVSNGWGVATSQISSGDLRVALFSSNSAPVGSGNIINLPFTTLTNANPSSLSIGINKNSDPNEDLVTWTPINTGDVNLDGHVDMADVITLMKALANPTQYETTYGLTNDQFLYVADVNRDGVVNNADLQALINLLLGGGGSLSSDSTDSSVTVSSAATVAAPLTSEDLATTASSQSSASSSPASDSTLSAKPLSTQDAIADATPPQSITDSFTTTAAPAIATQAIIASTEDTSSTLAEAPSALSTIVSQSDSSVDSATVQTATLVTTTQSTGADASDQQVTVATASTATHLTIDTLKFDVADHDSQGAASVHQFLSDGSPAAPLAASELDDFYAQFARQSDSDVGGGNVSVPPADNDAIADNLYSDLHSDLLPVI